MRIIELDASGWKTALDYCEAMHTALDSPEGHGCSVDAFLDSIVWGGMNKVNPPYTIRIRNITNLPKDILDEIEYLKDAIPKHRAEHITRKGYDVDVNMEIVPLSQ